jgi:hypothetical protein
MCGNACQLLPPMTSSRSKCLPTYIPACLFPAPNLAPLQSFPAAAHTPPHCFAGTYERCGQWRPAVTTWEGMAAAPPGAGVQPDVSMYHSMLEVLWQSGGLVAQVLLAACGGFWLVACLCGLLVWQGLHEQTQLLSNHIDC